MRAFSAFLILVAASNFSNAVNDGPFEIVSDTKKEVEGKIYEGSCQKLAEKAREERKDSVSGKVKNFLTSEPDCKSSGEIKLKAKGKKGSRHDIKAGQWAIFFKVGMNPEGLVPAYCFADPSKPGKILLLQTPKSEKARKVVGKSLGFGLKCTQVKEIP